MRFLRALIVYVILLNIIPIISINALSSTKLEIGDAFSEPVVDTKNNKAYVTQNLLNGKLLVIDLKDNSIKDKISVSSHPFKPVISQKHDKLYVISKSKNVIEAFDLSKLKFLKKINLMYQPDGGSIISNKLARMYVPHDKQGKISVIDLKSNLIVNTIDIGTNINGKLILSNDESKLLISSHHSGVIYIISLVKNYN